MDNLALVYNKKLFQQAGIPSPTANWTWDDFRAAAKKLTDPAKKQFGWAYVNDGSEDTVWRFDALLWQAGGEILTPDGKHAAFNSPAGVKAAQLLQQMAVQDHSVYLDSGNGQYPNLFNSGQDRHALHRALGPVPIPNVNYGVQILPADQNHQTISGPDNWVLFNNGPHACQGRLDVHDVVHGPQHSLEWSQRTGDLPIRSSDLKLPGYAAYLAKYPGVATFVQNLQNAVQVRPVTPLYPEITRRSARRCRRSCSARRSPPRRSSQAASQVNSILAAP